MRGSNSIETKYTILDAAKECTYYAGKNFPGLIGASFGLVISNFNGCTSTFQTMQTCIFVGTVCSLSSEAVQFSYIPYAMYLKRKQQKENLSERNNDQDIIHENKKRGVLPLQQMDAQHQKNNMQVSAQLVVMEPVNVENEDNVQIRILSWYYNASNKVNFCVKGSAILALGINNAPYFIHELDGIQNSKVFGWSVLEAATTSATISMAWFASSEVANSLGLQGSIIKILNKSHKIAQDNIPALREIAYRSTNNFLIKFNGVLSKTAEYLHVNTVPIQVAEEQRADALQNRV